MQVKRKPVLPEQNNDGVDDEVAADMVWKQSRLAEDSIIVELFRVSNNILLVHSCYRYLIHMDRAAVSGLHTTQVPNRVAYHVAGYSADIIWILSGTLILFI